MALASLSSRNTSLTGSQRSLRPSFIEIHERMQALVERCASSAVVTAGLRVSPGTVDILVIIPALSSALALVARRFGSAASGFYSLGFHSHNQWQKLRVQLKAASKFTA